MPTRVSEERITQLQARIGQLNTRIEKWSKIAKCKDKGIWEIIGPKIKLAKETSEKDALIFLVKGEVDKARLAAGESIAYARILGDVESTDANIEKAEQEIAEIRQQIKLAKNRGGIVD